MSCGGLASTFGLGFFDHSSAWTSRCSSSRTLVKYSSSLSRSSAPRSAADFRPGRGRVEDALAVCAGGGPGPGPRRAGLRGTAGRTRSTGKMSAGTSAPLRVQDRPEPSPDRARLGKRVWPPMCSAANWSSEMLLRKPARRSGCGAPVRKLSWNRGVGPTSGCDRPEMTVKSLAEVLQDFQVRA